MKKTLITLMALSGAAAAASLSDAVYFSDNPTSTYTFETPNPTEWTVVVALKADALKPYLAKGENVGKYQILTITGENATGGDGTIGANTNYTTIPADRSHINTSGFYGTWTAGNTGAYGMGASADDINAQLIDWDNVDTCVLTLSSKSGSGSAMAFRLTDKTGVVLYETYGTNSKLTSGSTTYSAVNFTAGTGITSAAVFTSKLSQEDAEAVTREMSAHVATPEPSTATLSLLALAALASRRKRH